MAQSGLIGALRVGVIADTKKASASLKRFQKQTSSFGRSVSTSMSAAQTALIGFLSVAGVSKLIGEFKQITEELDAIGKHASMIGIATENLMALHNAAEFAGISTGTVDTALQRFARRIADASRGTGELVKTLEMLGLDAQKLKAMGTAKAFEAFTGAAQGLNTQMDKLSAYMKAFDTEGVALERLGAVDISKLTEDALKLGTAITDADAKQMAAFSDAWKDVSDLFRGETNKLTIAIAPEATRSLKWLRDTIPAIKTVVEDLADTLRPFVEAVLRITAVTSRSLKLGQGAMRAATAIGERVYGLPPSQLGKRRPLSANERFELQQARAAGAAQRQRVAAFGANIAAEGTGGISPFQAKGFNAYKRPGGTKNRRSDYDPEVDKKIEDNTAKSLAAHREALQLMRERNQAVAPTVLTLPGW